MFEVDADVLAALSDTKVVSETRARAQYQGRFADLNVDQVGEVTWSASGDIQANGSLRAFGHGDSLVPRSRTDLLAPNGQEVSVSRVVKLRDRDVTIPLGVFRITGNDGGRQSRRRTIPVRRIVAPGGPLPGDDLLPGDDVFPEAPTQTFTLAPANGPQAAVLDWEVGVSFTDRFRMVQRAKIVDPASPPPGSTMYSELQRLALFPLQQTLDDAGVPPGMVYEDRMSGVRDLAALVGGKPRLNRQGALTIRPADRWLTETVPDFDIEGTISWDEEQSDDFYNFAHAHSPDGAFSAYAVLTDDSNPLSVGRAGPSTYEHSSPVYTSQGAAQAGADTILQRLLYRRSRTVTVEVGAIGLLLDLSDFGWVRDPDQDRSVLGEVSGLRIPHDPTQPIQVSLIVAEEA